MFGIVLFVHAVQYPMLAKVPEAGREGFEEEYTRRAGIVIMPLMLIEAVTVVILLALSPGSASLCGAFLLAGIWGITFLVSVPCHRSLSRTWTDRVHRLLIWSNFARCLCWGARVVVAVRLLDLVTPA
jgi:hypothetical protein